MAKARRGHAAAAAGQRHRPVGDRDRAVHGLGDRPLDPSQHAFPSPFSLTSPFPGRF
jgi:hypothetical protein